MQEYCAKQGWSQPTAQVRRQGYPNQVGWQTPHQRENAEYVVENERRTLSLGIFIKDNYWDSIIVFDEGGAYAQPIYDACHSPRFPILQPRWGVKRPEPACHKSGKRGRILTPPIRENLSGEAQKKLVELDLIEKHNDVWRVVDPIFAVWLTRYWKAGLNRIHYSQFDINATLTVCAHFGTFSITCRRHATARLKLWARSMATLGRQNVWTYSMSLET
jgi:hypothetical protein